MDELDLTRPHHNDPSEPSNQRLIRRSAHLSWWRGFIVLPWVIGACFMVFESLHARDVASRQQKTIGEITAHDPANHSRYGYAFAVQGRLYSGWQVPEGRGDWKIGQQVVVYYDAADPSTNALRDFGSR